jgi:large subunit ribosomal protein L35
MIPRSKGNGGLAEQAEFAGSANGYPVAGNQRLGYTGRGQGKSCLRAKIGGDGDRFRRNEKKMPKLKTHTGAKKRFSKTGTGKIKRGQTKTRHILTSKPPKVKRKLGRTLLVSDGDYAKVARMIPYA